ncbi:MAG: alpha-ribazole phosphatase [Desulfobacteraceae bacterium]|nr:alpha-ribazole phosphatase [Desulfobacteraceae bacterium]
MIYLLRHGEITGASTKRFIGQTDVGLSRAGLDQANFWQKYFSGIHLDRVFSSPLSRAVHTAEIVSGLARDQITLMEELKEINLGEWDGKTFQKIKEQFPGQWEKRGNDLTGYRPPRGESFSDLSKRILPVFRGISAGPTGNILIVAHAGVNRMILCSLLKKELEDLFIIPQAYGCLNLIDNEGKELRVQELNLIPE